MLDLTLGTAQNNAKLEGSRPYVITTGAQQWSYAAAFPFSETTASAIVLRGRVKQGRIGLVVVGEDWISILSNEIEFQEGWEGDAVLSIFRRQPGYFVVRNYDSGPSVFEIEHAELSVPPPSPLEAWTNQEVVETRPSRELFDLLRKKWSEVPAGLMDRRRTSELAQVSDEELLNYWRKVHEEATQGDGFKVRGWFHHIYSEMLKDKSVMDVGSGLGIDGLTLAQAGARMTFVDIAEENLQVLKRLCPLLGINEARFHHVIDLDSLEVLPRDYDAIWCQGSMINAPSQFMAHESKKLLEHLPVGGRWIELCYPRERWVREGELPFSEWGALTDGQGTPWMEWYDLDRLLQRLQPAEFSPLLSFNFHNDDFNWFDLLRRA